MNKKLICRVCKYEGANVDWNDPVPAASQIISFKECYYKYTHLNEHVPDPFSQSLCSNCSTDLKNFHLWIEKAIETQKLLERSLKCSLDSNGIKKSVINEVIYLEECPETKFVTQDVSEKSESDNQHVEKQQNSFSGGHSIDDFDKHCSYGADELETDYGNHIRLDFVNEFCFPPGRKHDKKRNPERAYSWNDILKRNMGISEILANIERECATVLQDPDLTKEVKPKIKPLLHFKNRTLRFSVPTINRKRKKRSSVETGVCEKSNHASSISFIAKEELNTKDRPKKKPGLCSFCPKILHSGSALKQHELTHKEDRQRSLVCHICGLKTYNKGILTDHIKIHDSNRERKYKCEFCDKAFFSSGCCNVHRRIHLGQMFKCHLCPKEFFRKIDVDRHAQTSHSQSPLDKKPSSKRSSYLIQCNKCGKMIRSYKFGAHRATHLKQPFAKCNVCERTFYDRSSCSKHMRQVHNKFSGQYDDIVQYFGEKFRPRLSHVLVRQQEVVIDNQQKMI